MNTLHRTFLCFVLLLVPVSFSFGSPIKLIRTIGDDRPEYTFYVIRDAIEVNKELIYVLDSGSSSLNMYRWDGTFVKKSGTRGEGPGDLFYPISICQLDRRIFLLDKGNLRITEFDRQLNPMAFHRVDNRDIFFSCFYALGNGQFLGNFNRKVGKRGKIGIINRKGETVNSFFSTYPVALPLDITKEAATLEQELHQSRIWVETMPIFALNGDRSKLLISFRKPDSRITFYVYSVNGKLLQTFSHQIEDKNYKISTFYINASGKDIKDLKKYPAEVHIPVVNALGFYENYYIVFLNLQDYKKNKREKTRVFCMVFRSDGKYVGRFPMEDSLRIFYVSPDGTILASKPDEEVTKIYVYKLNDLQKIM